MEKEEKRKRDLLQAWHENKCYYLRLDPGITPMFPEIPEFYFDPTVGTWYQMPELPSQVDVWGKLGFPHMACLPSEAFRETDSPLPDPALIYPPGVVKVSYLYGQPMSLDPSFNNAQIDMAEPEQPIQPQELSSVNHSNQSTRQQPRMPLCYIDPETGQEIPIPEQYNANKGNSNFRDDVRLHPTTVPSLDSLGEGNNDLILPSLRWMSDQCGVVPQGYEAEVDDKPPPTSLPDYYKNISDVHPTNAINVQARAKANAAAASDEGNNQSKSSYSREKSNALTIKLPSSWRIAKDSEGRIYYYNTTTKETQWQPPDGTDATQVSEDSPLHENTTSVSMTAHHIDVEEASTDSEDDDEDMKGVADDGEDLLMDEDGDESDIDEEDDNDLGLDMELDAKSLDNPQGPYSDLSAEERSLLLRFSKLSKEERQNERRQKRERDREKREYERKRRRERHGKHRKDGLVQEHLIPVSIKQGIRIWQCISPISTGVNLSCPKISRENKSAKLQLFFFFRNGVSERRLIS